MRPNQNFNHKRGRSRGRGGHGGGGGGGGGGNKPQNILHRNFESNGPDVKIRGNAQHVYEKYLQLARDAAGSGDRVMAENYLQHAEHYYRIIAAAQASMPQNQQGGQNGANGRHNGAEGSEAQDGEETADAPGEEVADEQPQI